MATVAELQAKDSALRSKLASLESQQDSLSQQGYTLGKQLRAAKASGNLDLAEQLEQQDTVLTNQQANLTKQINQITGEIQSVTREIQDAQAAAAEKGLPTQSTGTTTANEQQGRAEGALPQNPLAANDDASPPTNASVLTPEPTIGVNGELRPGAVTQQTPPLTAAPGGPTPGNFAGDADAQPGGFYGASAPGDDSGAGLNPVAREIQRLYGSSIDSSTQSSPIKPRPNPLDRCASYTYNITIYLTTPELYSGLVTNKKKSVSGMTVLIRSGGTSQAATLDPEEAAQIADGQSAALPDAARNNNFPLDFYIDNLQIKNVINGKGTMSSHSATEMSFRIIEPNGITFIHNLRAATEQLALGTGNLDNAYLSQIYLMAIRFYGWDENGNLVAPDTNVAAQQSDRTAITEKFIPFMFTGIKFKIANKLTEYECSAVCPQNNIATAQERGVIPYNFQITSSTLKGLLTKDLQTALNKYQADLCKADPQNGRPNPTFTWPDTYEFQLIPPLDSDTITLKPPGETLNTQTAMKPTSQQDPRAVLPTTQSVQSTTKLNSAFAGMSIVQFIDQMVRQSGYIYQQQKYINDPKTGKMRPQTGAGKLMAWYRISVQAVPDLQKWDPRRRDYAYKITYQITPYLVTDVLSDYFPQSPRWTAPKEYQYWFTGQNNSILDFTQEFNNLYYFVVNAPQPAISNSQLKNESKKGYQPASNISSAGMPGKVNEPGSNAAQYLYSPADLARARMTIVGDPDWIQQGDVWAGVSPIDEFDPSAVYQSGPDAGGINFGSRETLFDIVFQTPADYDLNTGLISVPSVNQPTSTVNGTPRMIEQRSRYKAVFVVNNFSQGKFTQEIEGVMVIPDVAKNDSQIEQQQNEKTVTTISPAFAAGPDQSTAETRRLQAASDQARFGGKTFAEKQQAAATTMQSARKAALETTPTTSPYLPAADPTSGGQNVGVSSSLFGQYGATGIETGTPSVTFTTNTGRVIVASSDADLRDAFNQGYINKITQNNLSRQLNILQQRANNPVTGKPEQVGSRET